MKRLRFSLLLTVALFLSPEATSLKITAAETGNLERPTNNFIFIGNFGNNNQTAAAAFTIGVHPLGYRLNQVIPKMSNGTAVLPFFRFPANFNVALFHSAPFGPGALQATLASVAPNGDSPKSAGQYAYQSPPNTILAPNTIYYIVASAPGGFQNTSFNWSLTADPSETASENGWSLGGLYSNTHALGRGWTIGIGYPQFRVSAVPIPGILGIAINEGKVTIEFAGTLYSSNSVKGPYAPVPSAVAKERKDSSSIFAVASLRMAQFYIAR